MIKLRLWGLPAEIATAVQGLTPGSRCTLTLTVDSVSSPKKDRGKSTLVRVYVDAHDLTSAPAATTPAPAAPAANGQAPTPPAPSPTTLGAPAASPAAATPPTLGAVPLEIPSADDA